MADGIFFRGEKFGEGFLESVRLEEGIVTKAICRRAHRR